VNYTKHDYNITVKVTVQLRQANGQQTLQDKQRTALPNRFICQYLHHYTPYQTAD